MTDDKLAAVPVGTSALVVPSYIDAGAIGTENIGEEDVRIPSLRVAQPQSPQLIRGDGAYIEGLKAGDAFNDLSGEIYGVTELKVVIVRANSPHWVLFDDDRSVIERDVQADDPRTEFTVNAEGKRVMPEATKFYDYVILLKRDHGLEPMQLSFKGAGLKEATKLNGLLRIKPIPIFSCWYTLTSVAMKNTQGNWFQFAVRQAGFVDEPTYNSGKVAFGQWSKTEVAWNRGTEDAVPAAVDPAAPGEPGLTDL